MPPSSPVPLRSARRAVRERLRLAGELGALYTALVGPCEVEPGATGVLIYASTRGDASRIARGIQRAVLEKDDRATVIGPVPAPEEPPRAAWVVEVSFDWRKV